MRNRWFIFALVVALAMALCLVETGAMAAQTPPPAQSAAQGQIPGKKGMGKKGMGKKGGAPKGGGSRRSSRVRIPETQLESPDGNIRFTLLPNAERLTYTVTMGGATVIEPSPIVMQLDNFNLSSGVVFNKAERYEINERYEWYGAHNPAINKCNGVKLTLVHDLSFTTYTLDIRVFNDGIAFRHVIPGDANASRVPDEYSAFIIPAGAHAWYPNMDGHYEAAYVDKDISQIQPGEWAGPPATMKLANNGGYLSITEADLENYAGMGLENDGRRAWIVGLGHRQPLNYPFELRYSREYGKKLGQPAAIQGTITTPWRVVMIGRDLNTLVNSTIVPNLNPPPDPTIFPEGIKTDWCKPGRAVWAYVDGRPDDLHDFSRMAGELGYEYHVIEGVWRDWPIEQRKEIADYSKKRGVRLFFWHHSNTLRNPEAQEEFFKMLEDCGIAGAKIDFFDHEAKEVADLYPALLKVAAKHHCMIIFHGANKPTGLARTWPNDAVHEGIRGMESSAMRERARHQTILPFARYLVGPADYTAMVFNQRRGDSSNTNQIASLAILSGPLLTIAANPQTILDNPARDLIKSIPPVWDETIVLPQSEIGQMAAYARRSGTTWFLAVMCGPQEKKIEVPLTFLGEGKYKAMLVRDNPNEKPTEAAAPRSSGDVTTNAGAGASATMTLGVAGEVVENKTMTSADTITLDFVKGGGFIARFTK